jgi:hypothetical protein
VSDDEGESLLAGDDNRSKSMAVESNRPKVSAVLCRPDSITARVVEYESLYLGSGETRLSGHSA